MITSSLLFLASRFKESIYITTFLPRSTAHRPYLRTPSYATVRTRNPQQDLPLTAPQNTKTTPIQEQPARYQNTKKSRYQKILNQKTTLPIHARYLYQTYRHHHHTTAPLPPRTSTSTPPCITSIQLYRIHIYIHIQIHRHQTHHKPHQSKRTTNLPKRLQSILFIPHFDTEIKSQPTSHRISHSQLCAALWKRRIIREAVMGVRREGKGGGKEEGGEEKR